MKPLASHELQAELSLVTLCDIAAPLSLKDKTLVPALNKGRRKRKMSLRRPTKMPMTATSA
ncbi:hypothetical protein ABT56_13475 [Photobacterium aquae]|uniref:Uncharacterized protein n=1 Tax=Photobacterium aquae TaxID=1195763 RepID=A0A0J1GYM6_9GAMM|nr:hypothetical protein ABT56_13475 [Photobacterium aquae]